jgi:predicted kinase
MINTSIPTLIIAVGCPGSGKSTWWKEGLRNGSIPKQSIRINMDEIRYELTGNESDQSKNFVVSKIAETKLKSCLAERIPVIYWDNTSTKAKYRKPIIELAKMANYNVICVFWDLPLSVCKERNNSRLRVVPEDVIERMHNSITENPPVKDEGYDDIIVINS